MLGLSCLLAGSIGFYFCVRKPAFKDAMLIDLLAMLCLWVAIIGLLELSGLAIF